MVILSMIQYRYFKQMFARMKSSLTFIRTYLKMMMKLMNQLNLKKGSLEKFKITYRNHQIVPTLLKAAQLSISNKYIYIGNFIDSTILIFQTNFCKNEIFSHFRPAIIATQFLQFQFVVRFLGDLLHSKFIHWSSGHMIFSI